MYIVFAQPRDHKVFSVLFNVCLEDEFHSELQKPALYFSVMICTIDTLECFSSFRKLILPYKVESKMENENISLLGSTRFAGTS